jgi:hypothetical protein
MAKEVYRRGQSERMDENRTSDCAYANHQWMQYRELMILRQLSTTSIPSHHGSRCVGFETNSVRTAITGAALMPVQAVGCARAIAVPVERLLLTPAPSPTARGFAGQLPERRSESGL